MKAGFHPEAALEHLAHGAPRPFPVNAAEMQAARADPAGHAAGMPKKPEATVAAKVVSQIRIVRGQRVLLDSDLAELYGVTTSALNQAMRRNKGRFPPDFLLRISSEEWESLRSQSVILKTGRDRHRKFLPVAFTEHGAIMAATILNSPRAVEMSVYVVRAFLKLREALASHADLARKLERLEQCSALLMRATSFARLNTGI